jgi:hypothetical protein
MAAGTWKVFGKAKKYIGNGTITLGAGVFKMSLHRASASASLLLLSSRSTFASIPGEISARGGYVAGGRNLLPATGSWGSVSAKAMKFYYSTVGLVFTASGADSTANLKNIKYALIRNSTGAGAGKVLCFCTLSTAAFTVTFGNTLTITPAATGIFTLT